MQGSQPEYFEHSPTLPDFPDEYQQDEMDENEEEQDEILSDEEDAAADLDDYFSEYQVPLKERVLICRGYASYLAARLKAQEPQKKKHKK